MYIVYINSCCCNQGRSQGGREGASAPIAPQKMTFKRVTTLTLLGLAPPDMRKEKTKKHSHNN